MGTRCLDVVAMTRFVHRAAELEEMLHVERHVRACERCLERLLRLRRYSESLFDEKPGPGRSTGCLSNLQLEHYRRESLTERQMVRLQTHLRLCAACRRRWCVLELEDSDAAPSDDGRSLLATRAPDLDLEGAAEGVRILAGSAYRYEAALPACERWAGPGFAAASADVVAAHQLHFQLRRATRELDVCLTLRSPEGFQLQLELQQDGRPLHDEVLSLWTRRRVRVRRSVSNGSWQAGELLAPGHYFFGSSEHEEPWLALCVDTALLSPVELAQLGYDWCRRGSFAAALRCFAAAVDSGERPGARELLAYTRRFVRRFGLQGRQVEIRWTAPPPPRLPEAPRLDAARFDPTRLDELVRLVQSLSRQADSAAARATGRQVRVPEPVFRTAYRTLLRRLRRGVRRLQAASDPMSVEL